MAAKSKHPIDILDWLYQVLQSCNTEEQQETAKSLVTQGIKYLKTADGHWLYDYTQLTDEYGLPNWDFFGGLKQL